MRKLIICLLIVSGCAEGNSVFFEQPQPLNEKDLKSIPLRLRGEYISLDNNQKLIVDREKMILDRYYNFMEHKDSLEIDSTNIHIDNDVRYYEDEDGFSYSLKLHADSVSIEFVQSDTLFYLSEKTKLRSWKSNYFLNTSAGEDKWEVIMVQFKRGNLYLSEVAPAEFNKEVEELSDSPKIEEEHPSSNQPEYIRLDSKRELKEIIKTRFQKTLSFRKIN